MIPDEDARWQRLQDYYLNCIRDNDRQIAAVLDELDHQGFLDDAVVILTSDHGELGGAHGLAGKGATAYREQNNVPLVIKHPDNGGSATCEAVTSHLDLVPTILGCATGGAHVFDDLPGHDLTQFLSRAGSLGLTDIRSGALFAYNMFLYLDADFVTTYAELSASGGPLDGPPPKPDFSKRGATRSVTDGRHRFTRYFSPTRHHRPETIDDLVANNDLELFDLDSDPHETSNLATDIEASTQTILSMNRLMNHLIDDEVGADDGSFLPNVESIPWNVDRWDL